MKEDWFLIWLPRYRCHEGTCEQGIVLESSARIILNLNGLPVYCLPAAMAARVKQLSQLSAGYPHHPLPHFANLYIPCFFHSRLKHIFTRLFADQAIKDNDANYHSWLRLTDHTTCVT